MELKSNPYLTLLTIVFGLLLINFFLDTKFIFNICLFFSGIGIFSRKITILIEKIWFKISFALSQVIPNILLILIFFLILTPIAFLSKIFNSKTNFNSNNKSTTFLSQKKIFNKKSFERAW